MGNFYLFDRPIFVFSFYWEHVSMVIYYTYHMVGTNCELFKLPLQSEQNGHFRKLRVLGGGRVKAEMGRIILS